MATERSPIGWAVTPLKRYAEFSGRSSRAEFWWFMLAVLVCWMAIWFLLAGSLSLSSMNAAQGEGPSAGMLGALGGGVIFIGIFWLVLLIPTIAVGVRRLHDTNRSGWWLGAFYLLYAVYIAMLFGSMASMMGTVAAGATQPTAANTGMLAGTGILGIAIFVYAIALLVFYCLPGTTGPNRFGADPYGEDVEKVFA